MAAAAGESNGELERSFSVHRHTQSNKSPTGHSRSLILVEVLAFHDKCRRRYDPRLLYRLSPPLIALQFIAFGWRVNREISLGDAARGTWVLIPDVLNIMSLFAAVICLIVLPIATDSYFWLSRMVLGAGYVLIAFHPFTMAAHYRLWSRGGKSKYITDGKDYPYATGEELVSSSLSVLLAILAAAYIGLH